MCPDICHYLLSHKMEIVLSIVCGLLTSVMFAFGVYLLRKYRYWKHLKKPFHKQQFVAYFKGEPNKPIQNIKLEVSDNVIKFTGKRRDDGDQFTGFYIINPTSLNFGEGFHTHDHSEGFGFPKIIIQDTNTIYVEAPYISEGTKQGTESKIVHQAFVWRKESHAQINKPDDV